MRTIYFSFKPNIFIICYFYKVFFIQQYILQQLSYHSVKVKLRLKVYLETKCNDPKWSRDLTKQQTMNL